MLVGQDDDRVGVRFRVWRLGRKHPGRRGWREHPRVHRVRFPERREHVDRVQLHWVSVSCF